MKKAFLFLLLFQALITTAQVRLPRLISDSMVLQRDVPVNVWGWAAINEKVSITFNGKQYVTTTNQDGKWFVVLPAMSAGGPYSMQVYASNHITINSILFGDVWLCSGQSNMELEMERLKYRYPEEISNANNPNIRQFMVPDTYDFNAPHDDVANGSWVSVYPKGILHFSGVAYFFAKEIYEKAKVPIGLINAALGGSPAESWISEEALKKFPAYYEQAQKYKNKALIDSIENRDRAASSAWYRQLNEKDEGIRNNWRDIQVSDTGWLNMTVPGYWADTRLGPFNGTAWFRKEIEVPASMVGKKAKLELGRLVDADSVFINGIFVGSTTYQYPPRRYELAGNILREGRNTIAIKLISNVGKGGFVLDKRYEITTPIDTIDLKGNWKFRPGVYMQPAPGQAFIRWKPVGLYNSMIAPLLRYPIKGVIWYQGEANTKKPDEYRSLMETLITDWRSRWNNNFPFLFVQLANYMESQPQPVESNWAATRQAQLNTLTVPNTGMAITIDLGDWNDIHPENKKDVGYRLALLARKVAYKETGLIATGPLFRSISREGNKLVVSFTNTGKGLIAKGGTGAVEQVAIAASNNRFVWAKAIIRGNKLVVWNDGIKTPAIVRYAWADNPEGANLYNKDGLPASPFQAKVASVK